MHPALSVIFLTTLIGAGQGIFLALYTAESYAVLKLVPMPEREFFVIGSLLSFLLLTAGLIASFFHLGHPERAWRSAARWRTSWLSREVIVLPAMMGAVIVYGLLHYLGWDLKKFSIETSVPGDLTLIVGAGGAAIAFLLFLCTGMIYACIKFLQEWATWLTPVNYTLLGTASGFTMATLLALWAAPELTRFFVVWAMILTAAGFVTRSISLMRNKRIRYKSTTQTAIGVRHTRIEQKSQGFMGGSFNTREFFHGAAPWLFRSIKWLFLLTAFVLPLLLLGVALTHTSPALLATAFLVQYAGLLAERWFFFAQANHPQNLYYQTIS